MSKQPSNPPPPPPPPPPTRPPNNPPPTKPPVRGALTELDYLLVAALGISATALPPAASDGDRARAASCAVVLDFRLRAARLALREYAAAVGLKTPARRDPMEARPQSFLRVATTGGPVRPPVSPGEELTPSSAVATATAACGSPGQAANRLGAGAISGRDGKAAVGGSRPGNTPWSRATAVESGDASAIAHADSEGRAGGADFVPGAVPFALPATPPLRSFAVKPPLPGGPPPWPTPPPVPPPVPPPLGSVFDLLPALLLFALLATGPARLVIEFASS